MRVFAWMLALVALVALPVACACVVVASRLPALLHILPQ